MTKSTGVTKSTGLHWKQDVQLVADSLGRLERARDWLTDHQDDAAAWGVGLSQAPTASFLSRTSDRLRVYGLASFPGSLAEDAGLARQAIDGLVVIQPAPRPSRGLALPAGPPAASSDSTLRAARRPRPTRCRACGRP